MSFHIFLAMHIPDGFLSVPVAAVGWTILIGMVGLALRQTRDTLGERQIPLMGVLAAFVFAAQMINFPVAGGTSGHLLGGTLVAILVGPWAALLVMTSVIAVQSLVFQDGGLLAMGFNVFNMGILSTFTGYAIYRWLRRALSALPGGTSPRGEMVAAVAAAWAAVEAGAAATSLELAVSGTSPLNVTLPAMVGVHALIGIGEALITAGALTFVRQSRPDLIAGSAQAPARGSSWIAAGLLIALAVALASPLASSSPDGLNRVAADQGFLATAQNAVYDLLPHYTVPGIHSQALGTILSGMLGVLVVAGVGYGIARVTGRSRARTVEDVT